MALQISTGLATTIAGTSSLLDAIDNDSSIKIYSGAVPLGADDAIGSATLLCDVKLDGTDPLVWAHNGTSIGKPAGAVWNGTNSATGTASFFRVTLSADTGAASTSEVRVQGTVGLSNASNMVLQNVAFVSGVNFTLNNMVLNIPLAPR